MADRRPPASAKHAPPKKASRPRPRPSSRESVPVPAAVPTSATGKLFVDSEDESRVSVAAAMAADASNQIFEAPPASASNPAEVTPDVEPSPQETVTASSHTASSHTASSQIVVKTAIPTRELDVFLIDSGWNTAVRSAVQENLPAVSEFLQGHRFFVLNPEQSMKFIKRQPALVGADPILLVLDRKAMAAKTTAGYGFRVCLGHVRQPEVAISMLKWAIQLTMTASSSEMAAIIRKSAHRETLQGAIELIGEGSTHLLEFAPV